MILTGSNFLRVSIVVDIHLLESRYREVTSFVNPLTLLNDVYKIHVVSWQLTYLYVHISPMEEEHHLPSNIWRGYVRGTAGYILTLHLPRCLRSNRDPLRQNGKEANVTSKWWWWWMGFGRLSTIRTYAYYILYIMICNIIYVKLAVGLTPWHVEPCMYSVSLRYLPLKGGISMQPRLTAGTDHGWW